MGVFASLSLLTVKTMVNVRADRCELYDLAMPYGGRYCIGEGIVTPKLLPHECRYVCLQSPTCRAYNYNVTERTCTRFTFPCPQAFSDQVMEFVVFSETPVNQCYEWVPYSRGDPLGERMIATDSPWCIVSRLQVNGNDVVSFFVTDKDHCWGTFGETGYSTKQGYRCERLRVVEGCTIFWVPYTAGNPLPSRAVIGGAMANGDVPYVVKFDCIHNGKVESISGYYIEGATHAISGYYSTRYSTNMTMMVVL